MIPFRPQLASLFFWLFLGGHKAWAAEPSLAFPPPVPAGVESPDRAAEPPPAGEGPTFSILSAKPAAGGMVNLEIEVTTDDGSSPEVVLRIDEKQAANATLTRA